MPIAFEALQLQRFEYGISWDVAVLSSTRKRSRSRFGMKLYVKKLAPNVRRVMMFIAEKELEMPITEISDSNGESETKDFFAKNPLGQVPVLELASGACLSESMAICRMLDEQFPEPSLFGVQLEGRAIVHMWSRRVENLLFVPAVEYGHHSQEMLADQFDQIPAFAELCRATIERAYALLESQLARGPFVAGDRFSVADIVAFCGLELARVWGVPPAPTCEALCRWHDEVSKRPSAKGIAYITTALR